MIEQFINFVIRPPRADYNPDQYLWEKEFSLVGRTYQRQDLELKNARGHTLKCSHYLPSPFPEDTSLPCVIYCHGNSGCRADANEAAVILLPSNITVFTLDFSGSGLSDGDYVSLGWHEKDDLKVAVSYLRSNKQISCIGLWGRSMGAVTSLLYGAEDPSISGMVLDSAFSNLYDLMMELVDVYKIRLPKFTVLSLPPLSLSCVCVWNVDANSIIANAELKKNKQKDTVCLKSHGDMNRQCMISAKVVVHHHFGLFRLQRT